MLDAFKSAALTASGMIELQRGEVELKCLPNAKLRTHSGREASSPCTFETEEGVAAVTSHRVLWLYRIPGGGGEAYFVDLAAVEEVETKRGLLASMASQRPVFLTFNAAGTQHFMSFLLRTADSDTFLAELKSALRARAWLPAAAPPPQQQQQLLPTRPEYPTSAGSAPFPHPAGGVYPPPPPPTPPGVGAGGWSGGGSGQVGVAAVLGRAKDSQRQLDGTMDVALRDLSGLMEKAREMVEISQRLRATLQAAPGGQGASEAEMQEFESWLADLGIASPVTRQSAGAVFHQQLARQLADFLEAPLRRSNGILTLPEVFCLFNRARGAELVSPDDILKVCRLWPELGIQLRLRTFDSGLLVVQSADHSDEEVCAQLRSACDREERGGGAGRGGGLTAASVARELAVTLSVAQEQLLLAEHKGALCRDEGPDGLRFFANRFSEFLAAAPRLRPTAVEAL